MIFQFIPGIQHIYQRKFSLLSPLSPDAKSASTTEEFLAKFDVATVSTKKIIFANTETIGTATDTIGTLHSIE